MTARKELGPLVYRDPRTHRRTWLTLAYFLVTFALFLLTLLMFWPHRTDPILGGVLTLLLLGGFHYLLLWGPAPQLGSVAVHQDGIALPQDEPAMLERSSNVLFSELEWLFFEESEPWRGIRIGFKESGAFTIRTNVVDDPRALVSAIGGKVLRSGDDPEARTILELGVENPVLFEEVWLTSPTPRVPLAVLLALIVAASVLAGVFVGVLGRPSPFAAVGVWTAIAIAFGAFTIAFLPHRRRLRTRPYGWRTAAPSFTLLDVERSVVFHELESLFSQEGMRVSIVGESRFPSFSRTYETRDLGPKIQVDRVPGPYRTSCWRVSLQPPGFQDKRAKVFQSAFVRHAIARGLVDQSWFPIFELIVGDLRAASETSQDSP